MRQNYVSIEDNRFAQILINSFVEPYQSDQKRKFGIQNFFKLQNSIYCVIAELVKYKNTIELKEETKSIIDTLDRFFLICKISDFYFIK